MRPAFPVLPVKISADKESRAHAVSSMVEAGRVYLPESAPWLYDFIEELSSFPAAPHDDMVDACTQALNYLRETTRPMGSRPGGTPAWPLHSMRATAGRILRTVSPCARAPPRRTRRRESEGRIRSGITEL